MTAGVAVAGTKKKGFAKFYPPNTLKMLAESKEERSIRDSIIKKIMKEMHMSKLEALETMKILRTIFENNLDLAAHFTVFLELTEKEVEFLAGKEKAGTIWGKTLSIRRRIKETEKIEEKAVEEKVEEEEAEEEEEEERKEEEKPKAEKKKGKQVTLFDFIKKN